MEQSLTFRSFGPKSKPQGISGHHPPQPFYNVLIEVGGPVARRSHGKPEAACPSRPSPPSCFRAPNVSKASTLKSTPPTMYQTNRFRTVGRLFRHVLYGAVRILERIVSEKAFPRPGIPLRYWIVWAYSKVEFEPTATKRDAQRLQQPCFRSDVTNTQIQVPDICRNSSATQHQRRSSVSHVR